MPNVAGLIIALAGVVAGVGLLLVRPSPGEPERLNRMWPAARFYKYRSVRVAIGVVCLALAWLGLALALGWV